MHCPCGCEVKIVGSLVKHLDGKYCPWLNRYMVDYLEIPVRNPVHRQIRQLAFDTQQTLGSGFLGHAIRRLMGKSDQEAHS